MAATKKTARRGRRRDPKKRAVDGSAAWTRLENRRDDRHYVLVYSGDGAEFGVPYYESLGYSIETVQPGGVALKAGRTSKNGEPVSFRGHVLMSISTEDYEDIVEYGPDGQSGQVGADEIEDRMVDRSKGVDLLRGMGGLTGVHVTGRQLDGTEIEA